MTQSTRTHIALLLERLARLAASETWSDELNPAQRAALGYLDRANRFSRAPSQVADYLSATRGTVSQTLKALARKGLIEERRSAADKRSITYDVTSAGKTALNEPGALSGAIDGLSGRESERLERALSGLLQAAIETRGGKSFGLCRTCRHHREGSDGRFCDLLRVALSAEDAGRICHEHA